MFCVSFAGASASKEEVVYGMLDASGAVDALYVVNILSGGGDLTDYGDYTAVENLTGTEAIAQNGDAISVHTDADRFYYQGTLASTALPWNIAITYTLDGQAVAPADLAGQSGDMAMRIAVSRNSDVNETFFLNDALQISVLLDTSLCTDIRADNATVAEAAGQKQLSFTLLPGQEATYTVEATVHDFSMDAVSLAGVRMNLDISVDEEAIASQLTELTDAIASLDSGATDLQTGAAQLSDGLSQYLSGVASLVSGLGQLGDGASGLSTGAAQLNEGLATLSAQNEQLLAAATALQQATFDTVNAQLGQSGSQLPTLTPDNYAQALSGVDALASVKAQLDGVTQFVAGLTGYLDGVSQLGEGASSLATGAAQLSDSLAALPASADTLTASGAELQTGADGLRDGLTSYQEGTGELASQTAGMADTLGAQIDEALGGITGNGDAVTSFVSDKNTGVTAVQFVLKTAAIELPEAAAAPEPEAETPSFWQKLTALFGF